jgi:hypothetical protein
MDTELWNPMGTNDESLNFIPLKGDIDFNKSLESEYAVKSIPRVIVVTMNGDIDWDQTEF